MKKMVIIAGCNGAGKTMASQTILPKILACDEFLNADDIARRLSPHKPELANIEAGRLMLTRIDQLLEKGQDFAFETTLSARSHLNLIRRAKSLGYQVSCLFFWLKSVDIAISRVEKRAQEGGHYIPEEIIRRRYLNGLKNFFNLFKDNVDIWVFVNNSGDEYEVIAQSYFSIETVFWQEIWIQLNSKHNEY